MSGRQTTGSAPGANVFTIAGTVSRVKITGRYIGRCENFVLYIASRLVVNEMLGTCSVARGPTFEDT